MHLTSCEHPHRIYNKYLKEFMYVPCGKCSSCLRKKSSEWVQRLEVERQCWKYCLFFTLTYSEDNVPFLEKIGNDYVGDLTHQHQAPKEKSPLIQISELYKSCTQFEKQVLNLVLERDKISYVSVYDCQCFIKRLRKNLKNYITSHYETFSEKDYLIRYYLVSEYGPTTQRCHYHGLLFFSSEIEAAHIQEVLCASWKLGHVDTSFVTNSASQYVAKYLNCTTGLSALHKHKLVRPFALYTKSVPLGTLYFPKDKVQEIFNTCSPRMLVDFTKSLSLRDVPLWRTFQDRLYPKLSAFSKFSHSDRIKLYRVYDKYAEIASANVNAADFATYMLFHNNTQKYGLGYLHLYDDYINHLKEPKNVDLRASLMRWFAVSSRVCYQAAVYDMSVEDYVNKIELYYDNVEKEKLNELYKFQEEYTKQYPSSSLVGIDKSFLESILDIPKELLSYEEILALESYGIDVDKFTCEDLTIRYQYQSEIMPENTRDYLNMVIDNGVWLKKSMKTKYKNEYIQSLEYNNNYAELHQLLQNQSINNKF